MNSPLQFPSDIDKYRYGGSRGRDNNINPAYAQYKAPFIPPIIQENPSIPMFDRFGLVKFHTNLFVDRMKQGAETMRQRMDTYRTKRPEVKKSPLSVIDLVSPDLPMSGAPSSNETFNANEKESAAPTAFEVTFARFHHQDGFQKLTGLTDTSKYNAQDRTWEVLVGRHIFFVDENDIDSNSQIFVDDASPVEEVVDQGIFHVGNYVTVLPEYSRNASRDGEILEKHVNRRESPVYKIVMENGDYVSVPEYRINYQIFPGAHVIYKNFIGIIANHDHSRSVCDIFLDGQKSFLENISYEDVFTSNEPLGEIHASDVQQYRIRDKVRLMLSQGDWQSATITDVKHTSIGIIYLFRTDNFQDDGEGDYADTGENLQLDTTSYKKNLFQGKHTYFDSNEEDEVEYDYDDDDASIEYEPFIDMPVMTRGLARKDRFRKTNARMQRRRKSQQHRYRPVMRMERAPHISPELEIESTHISLWAFVNYNGTRGIVVKHHKEPISFDVFFPNPVFEFRANLLREELVVLGAPIAHHNLFDREPRFDVHEKVVFHPSYDDPTDAFITALHKTPVGYLYFFRVYNGLILVDNGDHLSHDLRESPISEARPPARLENKINRIISPYEPYRLSPLFPGGLTEEEERMLNGQDVVVPLEPIAVGRANSPVIAPPPSIDAVPPVTRLPKKELAFLDLFPGMYLRYTGNNEKLPPVLYVASIPPDGPPAIEFFKLDETYHIQDPALPKSRIKEPFWIENAKDFEHDVHGPLNGPPNMPGLQTIAVPVRAHHRRRIIVDEED